MAMPCPPHHHEKPASRDDTERGTMAWSVARLGGRCRCLLSGVALIRVTVTRILVIAPRGAEEDWLICMGRDNGRFRLDCPARDRVALEGSQLAEATVLQPQHTVGEFPDPGVVADNH